jgi:protein O-mannosyl-transferase
MPAKSKRKKSRPASRPQAGTTTTAKSGSPLAPAASSSDSSPSRTSLSTSLSTPLGTSLSPSKLNWMLALLLALATFAVYSRTLRNPFVDFDDPGYVTQNQNVRQGLSTATLRWAMTSTAQANWHPLTWLSHALDCQLFGLNPVGHHLTSVLFHVLNVELVFWVLLQLTGARWRSWLVAALFALHPINVESVAWIAERKNVLCMFFFLLTLSAYGWYARKPNARRYLLVPGLFVLGLAAKPMVVTLPFVLLLLDFWPLQRVLRWTPAPQTLSLSLPQAPLWRLVLEKLPLLALSAASSWVTLVAQRHAMATDLPAVVRLANAITTYVAYLGKMLWPAHLSVFYPYNDRGIPWWQVLLCLLFLAGVSAAVLRARSRPYLAVGWFWFLGTLVPVIGLIQVGEQEMADRYAYLPLLGIFVMLVWAGAELVQSRRWNLRVCAAAAGLVLAALWLLTWQQIGIWHSNYDLFTHAFYVAQDKSVAQNAKALIDLGDVYHRNGDYDKARECYTQALQLDPYNNTIVENLGKLGMEKRIQQLSAEVSAHPSPGAYLQLGQLQQAANQIPEARASYSQALKLDANLAEARNALNGLSGEKNR